MPDLLVIHNISLPPGEFGGNYIQQLFTNTLDYNLHPYFASLRGLRVSAHLLIQRDGNCLQFVPTQHRAWHAGVSTYQGRERCNDYSIGIELEGTDDVPYTDVQYTTLAQLCQTLIRAYPSLSAERIVGHSTIAPGRKTDPGAAFAWARLHHLLAALP
jgi:AmpD protein